MDYYYYLYRYGVRYTVQIIKVSENNPDQVYVESVTGLSFMGWVNIRELEKIR